MVMKNPAHPGRLVKNEIEELGLSVAAAAKGLGVTRQQLYNVINGKSSVTPEMALRLEKGLGSTADAWMHMQARFDLAKIREREGEIDVQPLHPKAA